MLISFGLIKDCACMSVTIDKQILQPGETARIRVSANLNGKSNLYASAIVLETDASKPVDEIEIHGQITGQIRVRPSQSTLLTGEKNAPAHFTVFCDDQNGKWNYTGFESDAPDVTVSLDVKSTSPTTTVYEGTVTLLPGGTAEEPLRNRGGAAKAVPDYRQNFITLKFANTQIHKEFRVHHQVELVVRRKVMTDPRQVTFIRGTSGQKHSVLVQSQDPLLIDAAACDVPGIKATLREIDAKTLMVDLVPDPSASQADSPQALACNLSSKGKVVATIPISMVSVP